MKIYSKSDIGLVRSSNQDSYNAEYFPGNSAWAVVCDGMGGANGGDIASKIAVNEITKHINDCYKSELDSNSIRSIMERSVSCANEEIYKKSLLNPELKGMGTTVVLALIIDDILHVVYAGDSRAYIVNKNESVQITTDHSMVQQMVKSGQITEMQAKAHPNKNIITRALGVDSKITLDYIEFKLKESDSVLICKDGLTNYVDSETICKLYNQFPIEVLADKLVFTAKDMGGSDNITVVLVSRET